MVNLPALLPPPRRDDNGGASGSGGGSADAGNAVAAPLALQAGGLLDDVASLKRDRSALQREVSRLRDASAATESQLRLLAGRLAATEAAQAHLLRWGAAAAGGSLAQKQQQQSNADMAALVPHVSGPRTRRDSRSRALAHDAAGAALAALSEAAAAQAHDGHDDGHAPAQALPPQLAGKAALLERCERARQAADVAEAAAGAAESDAQAKRSKARELQRSCDEAQAELQAAQERALAARAAAGDAPAQ